MTLKIPTIAAICLTIASTAFGETNPPNVGLFGLFNADQPAEIALDAETMKLLGCSLQLSGIIGGAQGDIGLDDPNQFALLACNSSVMTNISTRAQLANLIPTSKTLALLEGDLVNFPPPTTIGPKNARQYVFKISYYNNQDPDARDTELFDLTAVAEKMQDTYVTKAFVGVNHALGIATPDEIVVLYYDDPETGDRFRNDNKDFMRKIGKFNSTHLLDSVYYIGRAVN